jgi:hypothetical protein
MPCAVMLALTVDGDDLEEATAIVRQELAEKPTSCQTDKPAPLPRWQVSSVRQATRVDEHGFPVE